MFHHGKEDVTGGFGVLLGVVVMKVVPDVCRQRSEAVIWQIRPDPAAHLQRAEKLKIGTCHTEMGQRAAQLSHIESGIVGDHEVSVSQTFQKFRGNAWKFRSVPNIKPRQTVTLREIVAEPSVAFWRPDQPVPGLQQFAIFKNGKAGCTNAGVGMVGSFKIDTGDDHVFGS